MSTLTYKKSPITLDQGLLHNGKVMEFTVQIDQTEV